MYIVEKSKEVNPFKFFDYSLFLIVLALTGVGLVVLQSATDNMDGNHMFKQVVGLIIGMVCCFIIAAIDYKVFRLLSYFAYLLSLGLLVLVLFIGSGLDEVGTNGWIDLGGFSFQPSELAKILFVLLVSVYFERLVEKEGKLNAPIILIIFLIPLGLVFLQPDWGTAMVFAFIFGIMVYIAGFKYKYILMAAVAFASSMPVIWNFFMDDFQKRRILVFIDPELDRQNSGWQVSEAKTAIGSGLLHGRGIFQGVHKTSVPAKHTDFIFSVIGEELGFVGSVIIVALFFLLIFRCIYIARNARDMYGSFLVIGLTAMFTFHIFENIGMCIGLMPVTGIPLPFISYGGSAMITNYIAIGIILNVAMRKPKTSMFEEIGQ